VLVTDEDYAIRSPASASRIHSSASHASIQNHTTPLDAGHKWTLSRWNGAKGHLDTNHGFQDGAVIRMGTTTADERERLVQLPLEPYFYNPDIYVQVAR
jgi:hypothetical protein